MRRQCSAAGVKNMRFADYFFDGLFADLALMDMIKDSRNQVCRTKNEIHTVMQKLENMEQSIRQKQEQMRARIHELILGQEM